MSISTFSILSPRGDTIISRSYRDDTGSVHTSAEIFFRAAKFGVSNALKVASEGAEGDQGAADREIEEPPPVFALDGITYISTKTAGLYFLCTTKFNVSPNLILELLSRLAKSFRDFCGVLNEEAIRKNFILVYELLDEMLDYGFPQQTQTEVLKQFVWNEPIAVTPAAASFKVGHLAPGVRSLTSTRNGARIAPSTSVQKSVLTAHTSGSGNSSATALAARFAGVSSSSSSSSSSAASRNNEIFVDVIERVTCTFNASGVMLNAEIDGSIVMKSFLIGNPELRVALNEDLVLGKQNASYTAGVLLDDANFHECVNLAEFEDQNILVFVPPEGEFTLMNYRITGDVRPPFRISPSLEQVSPTQIDLVVRVRADIPSRNYGSNVKVKFSVPRTTSGVSLSLGRGSDLQNAEYLPHDHRVVWTIKKFPGGSELSLRARITLKEPATSNVRREIGPVSMEFEIPMLSSSNLQIRYLRLASAGAFSGSSNIHRWVRYMTQSASFACRLT